MVNMTYLGLCIIMGVFKHNVYFKMDVSIIKVYGFLIGFPFE